MVFRVETATNGTIITNVANNAEAVRILLNLHREGIKCIKWEIVEKCG